MNNPALNARRAELQRTVKVLQQAVEELDGQPADETVWAQVWRLATRVEHVAVLGKSAARKANAR